MYTRVSLTLWKWKLRVNSMNAYNSPLFLMHGLVFSSTLSLQSICGPRGSNPLLYCATRYEGFVYTDKYVFYTKTCYPLHPSALLVCLSFSAYTRSSYDYTTPLHITVRNSVPVAASLVSTPLRNEIFPAKLQPRPYQVVQTNTSSPKIYRVSHLYFVST